jgi:serine/threonine protein kinase
MELRGSVFMREVKSLVKLNHPCVVRILHWATSADRKHAEIHMEFASSGSLAEVLEEVNSGDEPAFWNPTGIGILVCGLVLGMRYVHSRQILHLDLKPSNIFLNTNGHPLIGDFGSSCLVCDAPRSEDAETVYYAAPELFQENAERTVKCDVFSFGLILYEMLVGRPVFKPSEGAFAAVRRLRSGNLPEIPPLAGSVMAELIPKCWTKNPRERPSFQQIFTMLEAREFKILPDADPIEIGNFCATVVRWEARAGIRT